MSVTDTADLTDSVEATLIEGSEDTPDVVEGELVDETVEVMTPAQAKKEAAAAKRKAAAEKKAQAEADKAAKAKEKEAAKKELAKPEKSDFTKAQARALTNKLQGSVKVAVEAFVSAYRGRIWLALGHATWQEYLDAELGDYRPRLPVAERRELVAELTADAKMSTRAIAGVLGVDQKTVSTDRQALDALKVDSERVDGEEETVVGVDGVERGSSTRTSTRAPKPVEDRFSDVVEKLDKWVGDLVELTADDEFEQAAGEIARRNRQDLARFVADIQAVLDRVQ